MEKKKNYKFLLEVVRYNFSEHAFKRDILFIIIVICDSNSNEIKLANVDFLRYEIKKLSWSNFNEITVFI